MMFNPKLSSVWNLLLLKLHTKMHIYWTNKLWHLPWLNIEYMRSLNKKRKWREWNKCISSKVNEDINCFVLLWEHMEKEYLGIVKKWIQILFKEMRRRAQLEGTNSCGIIILFTQFTYHYTCLSACYYRGLCFEFMMFANLVVTFVHSFLLLTFLGSIKNTLLEM